MARVLSRCRERGLDCVPLDARMRRVGIPEASRGIYSWGKVLLGGRPQRAAATASAEVIAQAAKRDRDKTWTEVVGSLPGVKPPPRAAVCPATGVPVPTELSRGPVSVSVDAASTFFMEMIGFLGSWLRDRPAMAPFMRCSGGSNKW